MKYRCLLSLVCILFAGIATAFGQNNTISIPDVSVAKGKTISLPVNMDNTADVVAVQFTLTVPEGFTVNTSTATLTERSDEHTITFRSIAANKYMAMVFSSKNKAIKGRTGKLLSVSLTASSSLEEGTEHQLTLSDVVIGAQDGSNLATGFAAGKVTVAKSPDLEVSQVTVDETAVNPDDKINVSWTVANIGGLPTTGGWSEQILLANEHGATKLLGTLYNDAILNAGGVVSRNAELNIPTVIGMSGNCHVAVKVIPNSNAGEPSWLQGNNISQTANTIIVNKQLSLSPDYANAEESTAKTIRFQLSRSGGTTNDEEFTLTRNADNRIILPESITIVKGLSSTYFYAQVVANKVLDNDSIVRFVISGNEYPEISSVINIEDDTYPSLSITTDAQDVVEGGLIKFIVTTERASRNDIELKMTCDFASRFRIPSSIVIPAGQTSVEVDVEAIEDDAPNVEEVVTFKVTAANHNPASIYTVLVDNDIPTLQLEITPTAVSEAAGPLAVTAKLRRTDNIDKVVTVKFSDDSDGGIYYGRQTIVLEKGIEEATVNLGPIDNAIVDGERTYNISAAVWIASCSCNANNGASGGVVSVPLTVYDNDGPTLSMTSTSSVLNEGSEMNVTVKRNTSTAEQMVVYLSSNHDDDIEYPASVVIPAGASEVAFTVKSKGNEITGDGFTATLSASAEGFATGNIWFAVSDQTLPDAQIVDFKVSNDEVEAGGTITVETTIANSGSYELPELTKVGIYTSNSSSPISTLYLQQTLRVGEHTVMSQEVEMPSSIGACNVYAVVNYSNEVRELCYTNNSSKVLSVKTISPYSVNVYSDKSVYKPGEKVIISGKAIGTDVADKEIEVYAINDNYRHTITAKTDSEGVFSVGYEPYTRQIGHFVAGACYPNEGLCTEMFAFDIYGVRRTSNDAITCQALLGDTYHGQYAISNPGNLPLSNVAVEVVSKPDNCNITVSCPEDVNANSTFNIEFDIDATSVSEGNSWQLIELNLTSQEGVVLPTTLYYYCRSKQGQLKADITRINTTMNKDSYRDYPFFITNTGKGETGKITLALPSWITSMTPREMASLASGDSATVILRFTPTSEMQLNVPVTGNIGINCENGNGLSLNYSVEPVSELTGFLEVDVCDEYTYYTEEAPHVAGATVKVKHPYTGVLIAEGVTDQSGKFVKELPEGYYTLEVTAEKHESYSNYCYINAGRTETVFVNASYQPITITWDVVETEVEDEYSISTTVNYETNVPVPTVKVSIPERIDGDNMAYGESILIYMTLTNVGLINAENTTLNLPENMSEWKFEPLAYTEPFVLGPQQSVVVPVLITRVDPNNSPRNIAKYDVGHDLVNNYQNCMAAMGARYQYYCGKDLKSNSAAQALAMKFCAYSSTMQAVLSLFSGGGGGYGPGAPGGGGGGGYGGSSNMNGVNKTIDICDPCDAKRVKKYIDTLLSFTWLGTVDDAMNDAIDATQKGEDLGWTYFVRKILKNIRDAIVGHIIDTRVIDHGNDVRELVVKVREVIEVEECTKSKNANGSKDRVPRFAQEERGWMTEFDNSAELFMSQAETIDALMLHAFGDEVWTKDYDAEKLAFLQYALALPEDYNPSDEELMAHKPASVTLAQMRAFVEHIHSTLDDETVGNDIIGLTESYRELDEYAFNNGFNSMTEYFSNAYDEYGKHIEELASQSVCASITLQFSQTMTMTRQAFRGTLSVYNGHASTAMQDVRLNLEVRNVETGETATLHEFQTNAESITGFQGELDLTAGWSLDAQETGVATVLFIPTKYAAPTEPQRYSFGGSVTYIDPYSGLEVTRDLFPVTLTVKPSPNLDLTYFMQRDIKGDDPLTQEIEPSEEAEFSLLINNIGYGDAANVKLTTEQPKIIDNEKGLLIDFELISSQLNGGDKTLALGGTVATDFGTIPAKSTSYAQWWIKSSLLGHFTSYNVEATHVTSYGNPDLSLLNDVTIHELIRSIDVEDGEAKAVGFMTNDIADAEDTPDMLYLSNGEIETVALAQGININKVSDADYALTVSTTHNGWNYGNIVDPTYGVSTLKSVIRQSDGKEMSLRNFWQTDRTLRDGKDPLYENRIHFADNITSANGETYILTFEPTPDLLLEVASIEGVPEEGRFITEPLDNIKVMFNKYIDPATFTTEDIALAVQGVKQDVSKVAISTDDNKTFTLDFSVLNETVGNGCFVLTINTSDVKDVEGYFGKNGKQAGWIMFHDGLVALNSMTLPAEAGVIQRLPASSDDSTAGTTLSGVEWVDYGSAIRLSTIPNEGYEFKNWTVNGEVISSEPNLEYVALGDMNIKANYALKTYSVSINESNEGGAVTGAASGVYSYGDVLNLVANADDEFVFDGWEVNNQNMGSDNELSVIVNEVKDIKANFKRDVFHQSIKMSRGWNWVSSYVNEPIPVSVFYGNANHIVSQFDEIINDPAYGMIGGIDSLLPGVAYKMDVYSSAMKSFKGHLHDLANAPIILHIGWNWISYPYTEKKGINDVISNASEGDYMTSQFGFSEFIDGYWEGTLDALTPGYGYIYKSSTDKTLEFDFQDRQSQAKTLHANTYNDEPYSSEVDARQYPSTMNIIARISTGAENLDAEKCRIYAFAGNELRGESRCVGDNHYLTIYGDDATNIIFVVENTTNGDTFFAKETVTFNPEVLGSRKAPFTITVSGTTAINSIADSSRRMRIYSVEGVLINSEATTESLKKLSRGIYIIDGQKFMVK